jgi:hypothetical protein
MVLSGEIFQSGTEIQAREIWAEDSGCLANVKISHCFEAIHNRANSRGWIRSLIVDRVSEF